MPSSLYFLFMVLSPQFKNPSYGANFLDRSSAVDRKSHSYSGIDITAVIVMPSTKKVTINNTTTGGLLPIPPFFTPPKQQIQIGKGNWKTLGELQTISISSASQIWPVKVLGRRQAITYTKGSRSFAGTMVFAIINKDIFYELFDIESRNAPLDKYYLDMLPEFDVVITATNELGDSAIQVITGITISHWGTTYSVDDLFTESTVTYVARHVTPFIRTADASSVLTAARSNSLISPKKLDPFNPLSLEKRAAIILDKFNSLATKTIPRTLVQSMRSIIGNSGMPGI